MRQIAPMAQACAWDEGVCILGAPGRRAPRSKTSKGCIAIGRAVQQYVFRGLLTCVLMFDFDVKGANRISSFRWPVVLLHTVSQPIPRIDRGMTTDFLLLFGRRSSHWSYLYINVPSGTAVQSLVQSLRVGVKFRTVCPKSGCVNRPRAYPPDFWNQNN
jgi:hypothetical protein